MKIKTRNHLRHLRFLDGTNNYLYDYPEEVLCLTGLQFYLHRLLEVSFLNAVQIIENAILSGKDKIRDRAAWAMEAYNCGQYLQAYLERLKIQTTAPSWEFDYSDYHKTVDDIFIAINDEAKAKWLSSNEYLNLTKS